MPDPVMRPEYRTGTAISGAGAATVIIAWGLKHFGIEVPPDVRDAFLVLLGIAGGFLVHRGTSAAQS